MARGSERLPGGNSPLQPSFFHRNTRAVARDLLGCRLRSTVGKVATAGIIVETEAYVGSHDPASHAVATVGRTRRNASMFGPPGRAYVYRSYGIHWCLNVVTEPEGFPAAVLIRGLAPLEGTGEMARRRGGRRHPLCAGPGRLAQALGVTGELDGHPLWKAPLTIGPCEETPDVPVGVSGRIGIRHATDWPLRFFLRGSPGVSGNPR